jgi:hypothetical protein
MRLRISDLLKAIPDCSFHNISKYSDTISSTSSRVQSSGISKGSNATYKKSALHVTCDLMPVVGPVEIWKAPPPQKIRSRVSHIPTEC